MATTIQQAFFQFKANLEITGLQATTISSRQQSVRDVLASGMTVLDSFLTGSYARSTMIAPLKDADIDIFFILDPLYFNHYNGRNGGQAGLLDFTKRTLLKTYTRTPDISRNGQAVTIRFDDFVVDVVPGFNRQGGGFLMPSSITNTWISTNPKRHVELVANANQVQNGNLVPILKMLKCWNRSHSALFRSFHLEVLALQIFQGVTISDYPSGVRFYFDKARALVSQQNLDPAGYGGDVGSYINTQEKLQEAVNRLQTAFERAIQAENLASSGYVRQAIDKWRTTFGDYFPAYG